MALLVLQDTQIEAQPCLAGGISVGKTIKDMTLPGTYRIGR